MAWKGGWMNLHAEILNDDQRAVLPVLGAWTSGKGFYLGGGTAIALHLGHRRSVDFDWFTGRGMQEPLILAEAVTGLGLRVEDVQVATGTLHARIGGVRTSFFEYPYALISQLESSPELSVRLASLDDLACMKLAAIAQRGSRKDFVDIDAIIAKHTPLPDLLALYQRKYSIQDIGHVLVGLAYFDDADNEPMPLMLSDVTWDGVKQRMRRGVQALTR